jgi:hypothetical protein
MRTPPDLLRPICSNLQKTHHVQNKNVPAGSWRIKQIGAASGGKKPGVFVYLGYWVEANARRYRYREATWCRTTKSARIS